MATTSKAWVVKSQTDDLSGLVLEDVQLAQDLGDHDVLVDMRAGSLNYKEIVVAKVSLVYSKRK